MKIEFKPSLVSRYLVNEYVTFQLAALSFLYLVLLINQLLLQATNLLSKNVPFIYILQLLIYASPSVLLWALPFSSIIGALMALSRLVADNEILALRLAGFSLGQLIKPFYFYAIVLLIVSLIISNILMPASYKGFQEVSINIAQSQAHDLLKSRATRTMDDKLFSIFEVKGTDLKQVIIVDTDDSNRQRVIVAPSGSVTSQVSTMNINLNDAVATATDKNSTTMNYGRFTASQLVYGINFSDVVADTSGDIEGMNMIQLLQAMNKEHELDKYRKSPASQDKNYFSHYEQAATVGNPRLEEAYAIYQKQKVERGINHYYRTLFINYYEKVSLALLIVLFAYLAFTVAFFVGKAGIGLALAVGVLLAVGYWVGVYIVRFSIIQYNLSIAFLVIPDVMVLIIALLLQIKVNRL